MLENLRAQLPEFLITIKDMIMRINSDTTEGDEAHKIRILSCKKTRNTASSDISIDLINAFAKMKLAAQNQTMMLDHKLLLDISVRFEDFKKFFI